MRTYHHTGGGKAKGTGSWAQSRLQLHGVTDILDTQSEDGAGSVHLKSVPAHH